MAIRRLARNGTGIRVIWRNEKKRERERERGKKVQFGEHTSRLGEESLAWPIEDGLKI